MGIFGHKQPPRPSFFEGVPTGAAHDSAEKVIVVGAGAAGLSAARVLRDEGCEVIVLEGRERLGGRLNTIDVGGGMVEEGGAWVSDAPTNPLYRYALDAGIALREDNFIHPLRLKMFDKISGRGVDPFRTLYYLLRVSRVLDRYGDESLTARNPEPSLGDRLAKEFAGTRGATSRRRVRFMLRMLVELVTGSSAEKLHPNAIAMSADQAAGKSYLLVDGYRRLIEHLADGLDIRLGTTVESIRYDDDGVEVVTQSETHRGTSVIVTVPLGVLKGRAITFDPALPTWKLEAIENVGLGFVEKIVLRFDRPFWRPSPQKPRSVFYLSDTPGEFPAFVDATSSAGCPMLVAFLTGDQLRRLADTPDSFVDRATEVLKEIFPDTYAAPTAVHISNWGNDPFSLCSYSAPTIGVSVDDYEQLAEPVSGRVLFAGEATYREHAGYVEGAIGSGIREARRLLGRDVDLRARPS